MEDKMNDKFVYTDDDEITLIPGDPDDDLSDVLEILKNGFPEDD